MAAIIFLLPDREKQEIKKDNNNEIQGLFNLQPVKTSLACRFFVDSSGVNVVSFDSVNTILYSGDVYDVDFNFQIEDLTFGQKQIYTGNSKYFRFEEKPGKRELIFYWLPPLNDISSRTYLIKIKASAKYKDAKIESPELFAETQFSIVMSNISEEKNVFVDDNRFAYWNGQNEDLRNNPLFGQPIIYPTGDATLEATSTEVISRAYEKWENKIYVLGGATTSDLAKKPEIKYFNEPEDNKGTAEIGDIEKNFIEITGRTPSHGKMKVKVIAKFKYNNSIKEIDFNVTPVTIEKPRFESVMYPDKNYKIDSRLPFLKAQKTSAYLKDKGNVILKIEQGEPIDFKPDITQVGKILTLERYIDENIYDKYDIRILDYPNPIINEIQVVSESEVNIITKSYGFYNREKNLVRLDIKGNAVVSFQPRGKIPAGEDEITTIQIFKVVQKQKDKPFTFEVKAIDLRGKESPTKNFTQ